MLDLEDLSTLVREAGTSNGHAASESTRPTIPSFMGVRRAPEAESFSPGRSIDPGKTGGFDVWNTEKRPFGREAQTLGALRAIRDFDPQASQAASNFLRLMNPGHDFKAVASKTKDGRAAEVGGEAQAILDDLAERVCAEYGGGGLDNALGVWALSLVTDGAIAGEMVPWPDLKEVEDWYPIAPLALTYKRMPVFEGDKVGKLTLGKMTKIGQWEPVNANQVFYLALDPDVNEPYGRPLFMSALQTVISKSMMLNDLRAVAHNQGYPRLDVKVIWDALMKAAPPNLRDGGQDRNLISWMQSQLQNIVEGYNHLNVDDTYVHYDWVDVGMVGPNYAATSFDFKGFEAILTRQINSSLKTLPVLTGYNETTSETHGSIQWQIQVATIRNMARLVKRLVEKLGNASLRLHGIDAKAKLTYNPIRSVDRKFEAESDYLEAKALQLDVQMGWVKNDDAAMKRTDGAHGAVHDPIYPGATGKDPGVAGDPSSEKEGVKSDRLADAIAKGDPEKGADVLGALLEDRAPMVIDFARAVIEDADELVERFGVAGGVIFMQAKSDLIELLKADGTIESDVEKRDTARDVADYVFGLRFTREMKRLLREAIREGMVSGGLADDVDVPERIVDRIWRTNRVFVERIKNDLKAQLRAGAFRTVEDVEQWFRENAYRETLMGRFLARQGVTAGFAYAHSIENTTARFMWVLGDAQHCGDCESRNGTVYSFEELMTAGFPGSINLECAANCKCSLVDEG